MPAKKAETPDHPAVEKIVLLMVSGIGEADLEAACVGSLGIPQREVTQAIQAARRRLTLAARTHRDKELGQALTRLNDCYCRSLKASDIRTALGAQKELNRLLDLYGKPDLPPEPADEAEAAELRAIAAHLLPLQLAPEAHPLREHARVAAERIRDLS